MKFEPVIGLEVHAQLSTESKIFCGCSTRFGDPPNEHTCPVCLGLPGALPVLNGTAVQLALRAALALQFEIPPVSIFARKNYFYPDLPKGYQISQYDQPLAINGTLNIPEKGRRIRIRRLHLEEDAGKLLHEGVESGTADASYVDLNRSGVPLIEIVSEPDIGSPEEAYLYLKELRTILQFTEVSLANMEKGNLRCDANISLRQAGSEQLGTKVEIKNLNSFKNVQKALEFEIDRQTQVLLAGEQVVQETRLFNANKGTTESMRSKEEAHDYRYFPEPDLLPVIIESGLVKQAQQSLPELPEAKRGRFILEYSLTAGEARVLTEEKALADYFEETARSSREPKQAANWILRDLLEKLKDTPVEKSRIRPGHLSGLIRLIGEGAISLPQGKEVFAEMWNSGKDAAEIVREKGLAQISDSAEIERLIEDVLAQNTDLAKRYRDGETKLLGVLTGMVMKASGGNANPKIVNQRLREKLAS